MTDMSDPGPDREKGMLVRDGIGRARLRFGAILFETVFQPAYRVEGGMLRPDFATARLRPEGRETAQHVLASLAEGPGAGQAAALARCNLVFLDPETLCYCEDHLMSAAMAPATLDLMLAAVRDAFMMPDQIVWRLPLRVACDAGETIARARAAGIRIALRLAGADPGDTVERAIESGAQMLHLGAEWSGAWLENVPEAQSLLGSLVERVRQSGCGVSMTGISTAAQLDVALGAGVQWVQGGYLAPAVAAGQSTGWQELNAAALRRPGGNVRVLKRHQAPRDQQY